MSPTMWAVPAMEPSQRFFLCFREGGTTSATGLPNLVTRIGRRVLRTRSRTPRQVALNLEIAISSMVLAYTMTIVNAAHYPNHVDEYTNLLLHHLTSR
jgi:hypothetical protein